MVKKNYPIALIAAMSENHIIGNQGQLIWQVKEDMARVKALTTGKALIMGRKTWESIPPKFRPLPNRKNIILTHQKNYVAEGATVTHSWEDALKEAQERKNEIIIFGGEKIYQDALPIAQKIYLTRFHQNAEGDASFPEFSEEEWALHKTENHPASEKNPAFTFEDWARK